MNELRISDADLQAIIATKLKAVLKKHGFKMGAPSDDTTMCWFPINLNLADQVKIESTVDGYWTITQEDGLIADRMAESLQLHAQAIVAAEKGRPCR